MTEMDEFLELPPGRLAAVVGGLRRAGLTVATAESLTGGLLGAALSSVPGSSAVLRGGLIVYATDLKHTLAGVPAELLAARGPVDPDVAVALAAGARKRCGADLGVGLTGVAGPDPQDGHPPGTWFVAVTGPDLADSGTAVATARTGHPVPDDNPDHHEPQRQRHRIRLQVVSAALDLLAERCTASGR